MDWNAVSAVTDAFAALFVGLTVVYRPQAVVRRSPAECPV
jgi:hypothetical protein